MDKETKTEIKMFVQKVVIPIMAALVLTSMCFVIVVAAANLGGMPDGYVGGTLAPNGDVIGGHPSEEQMAKDRAAAGVSVIISNKGAKVFTGENAEEFAIMDRGYV